MGAVRNISALPPRTDVGADIIELPLSATSRQSLSALGGPTRRTKETIVQAARLDPNCPQTMIR
jgi:hypothetical protein